MSGDIIAVATAIAARNGLLDHAWIRASLRVVALLALVAIGQWFVGVLGEVRTLRGDLSTARNITPEDATHATAIRDLQTENRTLSNQLTDAKVEISGLRGQLSTATTVLSTTQSQLTTSQSLISAGQSQVSDLQQQLERQKQPPAVVVGSGGGVPINQSKMNMISALSASGRNIRDSVPRANGSDDALKPWIDRVNLWYIGAVAALQKECTPQAVVLFTDRSWQLGAGYNAVHSNTDVQNYFHALNGYMRNITTLLQKPEVCH